MNAYKFVNLVGLVGAIEVINGAPEGATDYQHDQNDNDFCVYVLINSELSELNRHQYWHEGDSEEGSYWREMDNIVFNTNLLEEKISLDQLRQAISDFEVLQQMSTDMDSAAALLVDLGDAVEAKALTAAVQRITENTLEPKEIQNE